MSRCNGSFNMKALMEPPECLIERISLFKRRASPGYPKIEELENSDDKNLPSILVHFMLAKGKIRLGKIR